MKHADTITHAVLAMLLLGVTSLHAQERPKGYPSKPVRVVLGNPPGGSSDVVVRLVAQKLGERWNSPVVMDYIPGADGAIAIERVAQAAPDGHTMMAGGSIVEFKALSRTLSFDLLQGLQPVVLMSNQSSLLMVHNSVPAANLHELAAYARARPGQLNYAGSGPASHLTHEMLNSALGIQATHIPYKGTVNALRDLLAGRVQMMLMSSLSGLSQIREGSPLRAIAYAGPRRLADLPDLPTIAESGVPDFEHSNGYALWMPAKTPAAIALAVNRDVSIITHTPEVMKVLAAGGSEPVPPHTPADYRARMAKRIAKWESFIKASGIKLEQ